MKLQSLAFTVMAAALIAACGESPQTGAPQTETIDSDAAAPGIESAWVRAPAPGRDVTAGYATFIAGAEDDQLVAVTSPAAARVEVHTMEMDGDVMRMRQIEALDLPAGEPVSLVQGGDHLMLFGVEGEALGETIDLTFRFASGAEATVSADVRSGAATGSPEMSAAADPEHEQDAAIPVEELDDDVQVEQLPDAQEPGR